MKIQNKLAILISTLGLLLGIYGIANAQVTSNLWKFVSNSLLPVISSWDIGNTTTRIHKIWGTTTDTTNLTVSGVTGSTQCLHVNTNGVVSGTGADCGSSSGTVTSVGLSLPGEFTISNSPVTGSGTLTGAWASQTANYILAAPNGLAGTPAFRALVAADIPALSYEVPLTFSTGLTRAVNTVTVNTSQNIATLSNLTSNGFVKTSGGNGTLSVDTNTYLTALPALTSANIWVGNGSNVATAVSVSGDAALSNTGVLGVNKTRLNVRNETGTTIASTKAVYVSGFNNLPLISLAENTIEVQHNVVGITIAPIANQADGFIATSGQIDAETNGWTIGTELYLSTSGDLTSTIPTSGSVRHIAIVTVQANYPVGKLLIYQYPEENYIAGGTGVDVILRTGDSVGTNKFSFRNYANTEKASINSNGVINSDALTASKVVFTDASKNLTSTGIGTSSQFIKADGSLDSTTYESAITAGTTAQYWRGDKSWQTLNQAAVAGLTTSSNVEHLSLGLGTPPTAQLHLGSYTANVNSKVAFLGTLTSNLTTSLYGIQNQQAFNPTGASLSNVYGFLNLPTLTTAAINVGAVYAGFSRVDLAASYSGVLTTAVGHYVSNPSVLGGSITNNYGFYVPDLTAGGTNNIGLYLGVSSGTNKYNIYATGTAVNFLRGNTGIGTGASATSLLNLGMITTATSGNSIGTESNIIVNNASSSSASFRGYYTSVYTDAANAQNVTGTLRGVEANAIHYGSGTVTSAIGQYGVVIMSNTSGTITNAIGLYPYINNANGTITNAYGIYIPTFGRTGTVTNSWGIYIQDTTAKNYFGGNIGIGDTAADTALSVYAKLKADSNGKITKYNNIATVSNGVPTEYATVDLTAQTAAIAATTLYTPAASGMFRISIALQVTTAATTSSILGGTTGVVITYTEPDGSVAQSIVPLLTSEAGAVIIPANGNTGNTTTTQSQGSAIIYAKTGVAIQYAIGYTSVGATAMQYSAHLKAEAL